MRVLVLVLALGVGGGCAVESPRIFVDPASATEQARDALDGAVLSWRGRGVDVDVVQRRVDANVTLRVVESIWDADPDETPLGQWRPLTGEIALLDVVNVAEVCVVEHEVGHALGMGHVDDRHALLWRADIDAPPQGPCPWTDADEVEFERVR